MAKKFNDALNQSKPAATMFISQPAAADLDITEANYKPNKDELEAIAKYEATPPDQRPKAPGRPKSNQETKTKRVHLLLKPSTHEQAQDRATALGLSFNAYITELIKADAKKHYIKPTED